MRVLIHAALAASIALMPFGTADAAKRIHKSHRVVSSGNIQSAPGPYLGNAAAGPVNAAAAGNNANSMSGSNSAVENAIGRTNCC